MPFLHRLGFWRISAAGKCWNACTSDSLQERRGQVLLEWRMVEGFISQFNQPFLSSVKRACSLKRCQEVWLHLLDQCRVNSTHILVHFVESSEHCSAVMVWWFRPGPGRCGRSQRLLITKQSPLPFFGAMLALTIATELRRAPTIGM